MAFNQDTGEEEEVKDEGEEEITPENDIYSGEEGTKEEPEDGAEGEGEGEGEPEAKAEDESITFTPEQLELLKGFKAASQEPAVQQQEPEEKPWTTIEDVPKDQMMGLIKHFEISSEDVKDLLGLEEVDEGKTKMFNTVIRKVVENASSLSNLISRLEINAQAEHVRPSLERVQQIDARNRERDFYGRYPGLKPLDNIVKMAAKDVYSNDRGSLQNKSDEEIYDVLAAKVVETINLTGQKVELSNFTKPLETLKKGEKGESNKPNRLASAGRSVSKGPQDVEKVNPQADIWVTT